MAIEFGPISIDPSHGRINIKIGDNPKSTLNQFVSEVKKTGLAKQSKFGCIINMPNCLSNSSFNYNLMSLFCDTAQIPGLSLQTATTRTYGEIREMPYDRLYENIPLSFYLDRNMRIKNFFDEWMTCIVDPNTRHQNYYDNYTTSVVIVQYDQNEKARYLVYLYEVYPKTISPLNLDYSSNAVHQLQVSLNYKYWAHQTVTQDDLADGTSNFNDFGIASTAFNILGKFNPSLSGDLSNIYSISSQYFNKFDDYQKKVSSQFQTFGSGVANKLGKLFS